MNYLNNRGIGALIIIFGALINIFAYASPFPLVVAMILFGLGLGGISLLGMNGIYEKKAYIEYFKISWLTSGVAAIYANYLGDPSQLGTDAARFYWYSSGTSFAGLTIDRLSELSEGSGAIIIWRFIYDMFGFIGIPKDRYVGILTNTMLVSMVGAMTLKIARYVYGFDRERLSIAIVLFVSCGMLWMYSSLHIRDAFALLGITIVLFIWVSYLRQPSMGRLAAALFVTYVASIYFQYIRSEYSYLAGFFIVASMVSIMVSSGLKQVLRTSPLFVGAGILLLVTNSMFGLSGSGVTEEITAEGLKYSAFSSSQAASGSLGVDLIVGQSVPIKTVFGTALLFIFPIPFWDKIINLSAYHLFKSLHAVYMYFTLPLFYLALKEGWGVRKNIGPTFYFLVIVFIGGR